MNNRQKETLQSQLKDEQRVLKELKSVYTKAREDVLANIKALEARTDLENLQSIIYQKQYQNALKGQLDAILDTMNAQQFTTLSDYLTKSYEEGFFGVVYDLHGQGIPLIMPIDQEQATKAIQLDSKISEGLYKRLGVDTKQLKDSIRANVSRGIASNMTWAQVARNIENRFGVGLNRTYRIARTEGHRIQGEAQFDAQTAAKAKGADVVKQWDAALDKRTRPDHAALDGQIREVEEPFEIKGYKAMFPGGFGVAAEDINCRCRSNQRAKWALDEDELNALKERAEYFGLDKSKDFEDFKQKYLKATEELPTVEMKESYQTLRDKRNAVLKEYNDLEAEQFDLKMQESSLEYEKSNVGYNKDKLEEIKNKLGKDFDPEKVKSENENLIAENEKLDSIVSKYYHRPERGTPEFDEWREWKRTIDINEIQSRQIQLSQMIADNKSKLFEYKRFDAEKLKQLEQRFYEIETEMSDISKRSQEISERMIEIDNEQEVYLKKAGSQFRETLESGRLNEYQEKVKSNDAIWREYEEADKETERLIKQHDELIGSLTKKVNENELVVDEDFDIFTFEDDDSELESIMNNPKVKSIKKQIETLESRKQKIFDSYVEGRKEAETMLKSATKDTLAEVRSVGIGNNDVDSHLLGRSPMRKTVKSAYDVYPTEWVEQSVNRGTLTPQKVDRGYYDDYNKVIAISDYRGDGGFETAVHELGHRMERSVSGVRVAEKAFYERRTDGERLAWLGAGYAKTEVTRKDNFIDPYMGKDYGGYAYELVSMGFEYAYCDPKKLLTDPDMAEWIFGLLTIN